MPPQKHTHSLPKREVEVIKYSLYRYPFSLLANIRQLHVYKPNFNSSKKKPCLESLIDGVLSPKGICKHPAHSSISFYSLSETYRFRSFRKEGINAWGRVCSVSSCCGDYETILNISYGVSLPSTYVYSTDPFSKYRSCSQLSTPCGTFTRITNFRKTLLRT